MLAAPPPCSKEFSTSSNNSLPAAHTQAPPPEVSVGFVYQRLTRRGSLLSHSASPILHPPPKYLCTSGSRVKDSLLAHSASRVGVRYSRTLPHLSILHPPYRPCLSHTAALCPLLSVSNRCYLSLFGTVSEAASPILHPPLLVAHSRLVEVQGALEFLDLIALLPAYIRTSKILDLVALLPV